jgi:hypothetical protein
MVDLMVGHGPTPDFGPYVPDFIIVRSGVGRRRVFSRDGHVDIPEENLKVTVCTPEPVRPGCWPLVFGDQDVELPPKVEWFPIADEKTWRPVRAQSLLASARPLRGSPELTLRTVRAAAALVAVDIEKVARDLAAAAFAGESLEQTYERKKR